MTTGQPEKHIAGIFVFGHKTAAALSASAYLPMIGGVQQAGDMSFIIPQNGKLKNLYWDCDANSLGANSNLEIHIGVAHTTPSITAATPSFPPAVAPLFINIQGNKTTDTPPLPTDPCPNPLDYDVVAGQRVAVYVRRTSGSITRLRVSFHLEVQYQSTTWQLASNNTTVFYDGGRVGIGITKAAETLDVNGTIRASGLKLTGGNPGDVITQDPAGYARWQVPGAVGSANTAIGYDVLRNNTNGDRNTAIGWRALFANNDGQQNTAIGSGTLENNTTGNDNTAVGAYTLFNNISGFENTANGGHAIYGNTTGYKNTALGYGALNANTDGAMNSATGVMTLAMNTSGMHNTASGYNALYNNTLGRGNTAAGLNALRSNTLGNYNTAVGIGADVTADNLTNATAIGANSKVSTSNSLVLGDPNVNVGIGTNSPQAKLDIRGGSIKITDGNEGVGKVLTSDANGYGRWMTPGSASLPAGTTGQTLRYDGTAWVAGSNFFNDGLKIGIGTTDTNLGGLVNVESSMANTAALFCRNTAPGGSGAIFMSYGAAIGTNKYGMQNSSVGAAALNVAGWFSAEGATANYAIQIQNPSAGPNNYAVYSNSPAQCYFEGNVGIGTTAPTSKLQVVGLPVFADNADAIGGGLTRGAFYRAGDFVCVVH